MPDARLASGMALLCASLLAACTTTPEEQAARAEAQALVEAEIAARKGEPVNRVCPRGNDDWKALGDDVLLMEAGDAWYMLELAGPCDPGSAFTGIATRSSPASSCLSRGDRVFTGPPRSGARCTITGLFEWDEDASVEASEAEGEDQPRTQ